MHPSDHRSRPRGDGDHGARHQFDIRPRAVVTPAPTDPAAFTFLTMSTKPSFRAEFEAGERGKTAVYMARWVNTLGGRGEKAPGSEIMTATVAP